MKRFASLFVALSVGMGVGLMVPREHDVQGSEAEKDSDRWDESMDQWAEEMKAYEDHTRRWEDLCERFEKAVERLEAIQ